MREGYGPPSEKTSQGEPVCRASTVRGQERRCCAKRKREARGGSPKVEIKGDFKGELM